VAEAAVATSEAPVAKSTATTRAEAKARAASSQEVPKSFMQRVVNTDRFEGLRRFIRDTMAEIRKVIWPDRETTRNLTLLVIAVSLVLGILLGGIDFVLFELFEAMP
jgi:preprotein translocase subunit SecE